MIVRLNLYSKRLGIIVTHLYIGEEITTILRPATYNQQLSQRIKIRE